MYLDIYEAIEHRHLVQVYYGHYFRIVEPRVYGSDLAGHDVLKAYQVAGCDELGRHVGWKWFKLSKIDTVRVLATTFPSSRSANGARDRALQRIYCEVSSGRRGDDQVLDPSHLRHR